MRIDCCAACGGGRHNAPTRSPTSQAHTYRRACAPLRHVAPLGRTAHSVALYSRQRNGTPAATVRRSWLSCQSQSECMPLLISQKIAKFFEIAPKYARKRKKAQFRKIYFLRKFARRSLASLTLRLGRCYSYARPAPVAPSSLPSENEYIPLLIFFALLFAASLCWQCSPMRHTAAAGRVPAPLCRNARRPCFCGYRLYMCGSQFAASCRFPAARRRHSKPVSGIHYGSVFYFSPCPSAFCQRYHKKFFLSNHTVIRHYQNCTNDKLNCLTAGFDKKNFLWYKSLIDGKGKSKHTVSDTTVVLLYLRTSDGRPLAPRSGSGGAPHKKK